MVRFVLTFLVGGMLGGGVGFAAGIFLYPFIFLADVVATERLDDAGARQLVATGTFIHADPSDPVHYGGGKVTVYQDLVRLEDDFNVGPGPKYHVYLVPRREIRRSSEVENTMFVDLGRLRAFRGSQNFTLPAGLDLGSFGSVVIWCERFGVLISPATLEFRS